MDTYILDTLNEIKSLQYNWNENGADIFGAELLDIAYKFANRLKTVFKKNPFIAPTAIHAIQMEYELQNDFYIEFEVYLNRIAILFLHKNVSMEVIIHKDHIIKDLEKLQKRFLAFVDLVKNQGTVVPDFDIKKIKATFE